MEYRRMGRSSVKVSPLCLGTMNFGGRTDEKESIDIIHAAIDAGINFIDTANVYSKGTSEEIVAKALANGKRDQVVLATKGSNPMSKTVNDGLSSRYHIMKQVESSLRRLNTDHIDLYYIHHMDLTTPLEESMSTMNDLVRQGKIRYIGVSKWAPSWTVEALALCERYGWEKILAEQPPYSIVDRTPEHEMLWTCKRHGIAVMPWAPLAGGVLAGKYSKDDAPSEDSRFKQVGEGRLTAEAIEVADALKPIAEEKGCSLAAFATAWVTQQPAITSTIIGPRTMGHFEAALESLDVVITDDDRRRIDEINPPGNAVADYYDVNISKRLRAELGA